MVSVFGIIQDFLPNNNMSLFWRRNKGTCIVCFFLLAGITIILLTSTQRYCFHTTFLWAGFENDVAKKVDTYHDKKTSKLYVHKFSNNVSSEYIKLIKVYSSSLTFHDLLYESKRNNNKRDYFSAYSVTGNFRSKLYKTWDPHPEYKFTVFGHRLHLILHQDNSFITPSTFHVIRILKTRTEIQNDQDHYLGCYYKGYVQGDFQSTVAVSLCNGMTGHIKTTFGSFLIQPLENFSDNQNEILHRVWKHSNRPVRFAVSENIYRNRNFVKQKTAAQLTRSKRNYVDNHLFTMEVLVAVDKTMSDFHNGELKSYILTLMSIVSNIFADASIGNSIYISVPNILILKDDIVTSRGEKNISASQLLKHFCSFLKRRGVQYDTAIMLTRDQICRNKREPRCDTLGLAELGTVCKRYSCSIVQDNGLPAAFTIAHELGHILNMPHDDDSRCGNFKQRGKNTLHIMSSTMGDDIHPWSWSDCSRHYVSEFLEKEDTTCLEDTPQVSISSDDPKFAGELYTLDQQCRLIHGNFSKYCSIEMECARLWCKADLNLADCRSSNLPWADGTPCKNKYYWCQKGKCILREGIKHQVTNGGWGPWSAFTPCSMTCGGGVQESQRECNNPFPKNGGKYCAGSRKKYRSCNTQNCPSGSLDSREQQCYNMNGNDFGIKGVNSSVKWIPKYGLTGNDKCKLYCRWDTTSAYFQLGDKVRDGTTCSFDSFDKCVNGICRQAGCDNELNSLATLDKCGVCEGRNNTCEEFSGNFYKSDISNKTNSLYYYVTTIPKGSSNIVITQPGYHTQNYIVLRNASGGSLLNGDRVINTYRHIFFYAGVSFEYNGSHSTLERVNTSYSRKLKSDLIVEIISLNLETIKNDSILLSYSYTTDKHDNAHNSDLYQWESKEWSTCDALCQGTSFQILTCISLETGLKVPKPFCDSTQKPIAQSRSCNMSCHLTLNIAGISDCSATCGMFGKRKKSYFCVQTYTNNSRSNIVDLAYCEPKFEINSFEECSEGCWNYTAWSLCSQSCGIGQQTRSVVCFLNQTQVSDSLCNLQELPSYDEVSRFCSLKPCTDWITDKKYETVESNWITEEWGFCNDNCEKNRTVDCSYGYGCAIETKPIEKKKCCSIKYIATWSPCSVECGNGTRKKEFYCARVYKSAIKSSRRIKVQTDSKFCSKLKVPIPKRSKKSCKISCKWIADKWSTCSRDCRTEFQTRTITCATSNYRQISSKYCEPNKKPVARKMCSQCIRRTFKITKCNCEGYRRRRVICTDANGKRISCPNKQKIVKDKCQIPEECLPKSCTDIKRFHKLFVDKDYTIFIREKPKKIYCHNMNSKPKEYITLNPLENYSIYYDKKTKLPEMCPPEARSMEYNDNSIRNGRTHFHKININITSLHIIENDFTFADTVGFPQPFGSAGDCYNKNRKCPQGDFSINFKFTGFSINSKTRWETVGNNVIMKLSNESTVERRALCGGYCGRCSISTRTGLALDV